VEIVVASGKGGVGKSTITASLVQLLSHKKVAAVDADAEAPNLHLLLDVKEWEEEKEFVSAQSARITNKCTQCGACDDVCIYEAIEIKDGIHRIKDYLCEGCGACRAVCPIKGAIVIENALSGWIRVAETPHAPLVSAELDVGRPNSGKLVAEEKEIARGWVKEGKAKHLLVDSAAGIGCQVIASISGADLAILVSEPTPSSLNDLKRMYHLTRHFGVEAKLIINKDGINPSYRGLENFAKSKGVEIIGRVPYDEAVPGSITAMKTLIEYAPESPSAKEIVKIAEYVEGWL